MNPEHLRGVLSYDQTTGEFTRLVRRGPFLPGSKVGTLGKNGYIILHLDHKRYYAHRLAWFYTYGCWPIGSIDHKNGVCTDNRLANLRQATLSQNMANTKLSKANTSGFKGVSWRARNKKWIAQIRIGKRHVHLGAFESASEAHAAYLNAAKCHFGEFARAS